MTTHSPIKFTDYMQTSTGPIAKIDGKWCSVNGDHREIWDVRYTLNPSELERYGVENDDINTLKTEMVNKDQELRLIESALQALRALYVHGLNTGVAHVVLESMMSSEQPLVSRYEQVRDYVNETRAAYNV